MLRLGRQRVLQDNVTPPKYCKYFITLVCYMLNMIRMQLDKKELVDHISRCIMKLSEKFLRNYFVFRIYPHIPALTFVADCCMSFLLICVL